MAKRPKPKKRRDRALGLSPYAKYSKRPFKYSMAYYTWLRKYRPDRNEVRNATVS